MKDGLNEINELIGTWGSLICNNQGEIIQSLTPAGLNKSSLENISRNVISMFTTAGDSMQGISEVVIHYSQKKLFVVDLEKAFLVVICTPSIDISLLRMVVNVVLTRWEGDSRVKKELEKRFVERM